MAATPTAKLAACCSPLPTRALYGEMSSRRRHARSPAAGPLDDDDLLCEILRSLHPSREPPPSASAGAASSPTRDSSAVSGSATAATRPSSVSSTDLAVCPSYLLWRTPIVSLPTPERFSLQPDGGYDRCTSLGCRHGLFLVFLLKRLQVLVWDPITGDQHRVAVPTPFDTKSTLANGAVLRPAGEAQHFQVVLVVVDHVDTHHEQVLACVYSSKTALWGNLISTPLPYQATGTSFPTLVAHDAALAGNSLYWLLDGDSARILEFDLVMQSLAVIQVPVDRYGYGEGVCFKVMRAEGGGLGFLFVSLSDYTAQLWKRKTDCDGVASWGLARIIELD